MIDSWCVSILRHTSATGADSGSNWFLQSKILDSRRKYLGLTYVCLWLWPKTQKQNSSSSSSRKRRRRFQISCALCTWYISAYTFRSNFAVFLLPTLSSQIHDYINQYLTASTPICTLGNLFIFLCSLFRNAFVFRHAIGVICIKAKHTNVTVCASSQFVCYAS